MNELPEKRQENSKVFRVDSKIRQHHYSIGAIHYKDDYASNEPWKDIDLTWQGNRITKAPYELTHEDRKLTIRDKKSGEVSTIELLEIGGKAIPAQAWERSKGLAKAFDTDLEIVADYTRVKFVRILKSANAPLEAKFKVTGNFIVRASDEDGELPVESSLKDGILTETLKPDRPVKYPVRIDPTWQVGQSSDDCERRLTDPFWNLTSTTQAAGYVVGTAKQQGGGLRYTNITIAQGTPISDGTHLILRCRVAKDGTGCNTRISAEDVDDAPTFADDAAAFDTRWANRDVSAIVNWDAIPAWTADVDYNSPEIKTVIQARVNSGTWTQGAIVIFWDDFDDRSVAATNNWRPAYSWDSSAEFAPKLVITVAVAKRGWAQK